MNISFNISAGFRVLSCLTTGCFLLYSGFVEVCNDVNRFGHGFIEYCEVISGLRAATFEMPWL